MKSVEYWIGDKVDKWSDNGRILAKNTILSILVLLMVFDIRYSILNRYRGAGFPDIRHQSSQCKKLTIQYQQVGIDLDNRSKCPFHLCLPTLNLKIVRQMTFKKKQPNTQRSTCKYQNGWAWLHVSQLNIRHSHFEVDIQHCKKFDLDTRHSDPLDGP